MWSLERVNARLDRLYARQYDLECVESHDMDQEAHDQWKRTYTAVTDEIMDLEQRQYELLETRND